ncbi:DUF411 domain-containing protein [Agrobacterium vitis]|uniref:DUF411 domain-containing protein n=1 Tax=Agrobacterium TaxID=357 RepID=UPI001F46A52D|nr:MULTISPECIES: DUF411 domain-containing protein [Agrobacterium]MCF1469885.1 DUF411 domain-containing protein [Agrobacterium vitis]MCL6655500.1 metal-binding protein [Agrobacterium rubi]
MKRREFLCTLVAVGAMPVAGQALAAGESMVVYKDPNCGCCGAWADAMKNAGFSVKTEDVDDVDLVKDRLKVPGSLRGCHTAVVAGYYLEGHVPLEAVRKLLAVKPEIAGLAVAGMPVGSLGMGESPGASYDVMLVGKDGRSSLFQAIRP